MVTDLQTNILTDILTDIKGIPAGAGMPLFVI